LELMARPLVLGLAQAAELGPEQVGSKAANLARLDQAGFQVPPALVITAAARGRWPEVREQLHPKLAALGDGPLAVRSSATAEDLPGASYAGQYESYLDVAPGALEEAVRACWDSAAAMRVATYQQSRTEPGGTVKAGMAVIVQRLVRPDAAGVAFTANPVTGDRQEVVVSAVRGVGERLVSGQALGDEWVVRVGSATPNRLSERAINAEQAVAVAELARRVECVFAGPQDVEWALEGDRLYLLQARPMTSLAEDVDWVPPSAGYWMRNFRIGEWLHEPMTPLFQTWLLELLECGNLRAERQMAGAAIPFPHASINGWYYTGLPRLGPSVILKSLVQGRLRLLGFVRNVLIEVSSRPEVADRAVLREVYEEWRDRFLPGYRQLAEASERRLEGATRHELPPLIDELGERAGQYLAYLAVVGGSAWKMEGCLAKFFREHLPRTVADGVQVLLRGLPGTAPEVPAHAVQSLDWFWPTAGEMGWSREPSAGMEAHRRLASERERAEALCRAALARHPDALARFETLLPVCQRYVAIREEQTRDLTLVWPLLRRSALRLGEILRAEGSIAQAEDVFFLTREEVDFGAPGQAVVARRRDEWERQRRLVAPLTIGSAPKRLRAAVRGAIDAARTTTEVPEGAIVGDPASPGRASGRVRIVRGPADFDRFQSGEVLVAEATAPAWTPLFARAAAVVTDGGTLAAHASLVAREYGIPAVVGTDTATVRLRDGETVVVDGSAGLVMRGEIG
jgi:rifampicin phosphotransferase